MVAPFFFTLTNFGPPFYWGYIGAGVLAALAWSVGMAIFGIAIGWRAPGRGILASASLAMCFATVVNVPIYFIGRWLGHPAGSTDFTMTAGIISLIILIILGLPALIWPSLLPQHLRSHRQPSRGTRVSPEVKAIFRKLDRLMDDEKAQIDGLPEPFRSEVQRGADCDEIAGAAGEFGRDPRNPIPVNGPLGEVIYLSNLRTAKSQQIMFHRLGTVGKVDLYETVSLDGAAWDVLFLDLYHPRKSRRAPTGYRIAAGAEREKLLLGANEFVASFPDQLPDAISNTNERLLGGRMRPPRVREAVERFSFIRPADHQSRLNSLQNIIHAKTSPIVAPLTAFCSRLTEHHVQAAIEISENDELSKRGQILFILISMTAAHFWNKSLKFKNVDHSFSSTNSDVVVAEALLWTLCLIKKMMMTDFDAAVAIAKTDERGAMVPKVETDNLYALLSARKMIVFQIGAKTGWDIQNVEAARLKEYSAEDFVDAFTRRVCLSVGKQSIHDPDRGRLGHFSPEDATLAAMAIHVFSVTMPSGTYKTFKNFVAAFEKVAKD